MIKNRKVTLEQRIARLEKLLNKQLMLEGDLGNVSLLQAAKIQRQYKGVHNPPMEIEEISRENMKFANASLHLLGFALYDAVCMGETYYIISKDDLHVGDWIRWRPVPGTDNAITAHLN